MWSKAAECLDIRCLCARCQAGGPHLGLQIDGGPWVGLSCAGPSDWCSHQPRLAAPRQVMGVNGKSMAGESAYRVAAVIQSQSQPRVPPSASGDPQSTPISVQVRGLQPTKPPKV